jgi:hypothetical protein
VARVFATPIGRRLAGRVGLRSWPAVALAVALSAGLAVAGPVAAASAVTGTVTAAPAVTGSVGTSAASAATGAAGATGATAAPPPAPVGTTRVVVWFPNDRLNPDPQDCRAVFPVERRVPRTLAVAAASLRELFAGPTPEEAAAGHRSVFSAATAGLLKHVHIRSGTAYVDLHDLGESMSGATSSCGAAEFQAQVARTLQRYPTIDRVIYAFDGNPRAFYEWMNESCGPANDDCDPRPFGGRR